ncbi:HD domain-containing protein [Actinomadura madurae]|uniref:HD domain-containing protein n=1 Tax=Actinomadura madurae TaxID=1993 RepID=UPI002026D270|nr:HD domain-containing protein [Actinomadura madurae]URN01210.1 HD domain-containing protein [Actinomadura madurae]
MQPIDPADKRPANVQIAASIRAAILTGEIQPGEQLPSTHELADHFGVARMTVQNAVRSLREEGWVDSRVGSGVYVKEQAKLPAPDDAEHPLAGTAAFLHEMGHLKQIPRSGWLLLRIANPESVAEHSARVGMVGIVLAALEGADAGRTAAMCLLHDAHETRIGDVPSVGRAYVRTATPHAVTAHQTAGMPDDVAKLIQDLVTEFEAAETIEARVAKDADKIETLLQAAEYMAQGHPAEPWQETSIAALRTDSAKRLAQAIITGDPNNWWSPFAASYHELRKATRGDTHQ